jgi:uncharacterized protein (TIGR03089 family)
VTRLITEHLRRRIRAGGSDPLITYYDLDSGERTELSATSFGNWVDKTSHLLVHELGVDVGDVVRLSLAESHPGHWVTFVWELACWQVGAAVGIEGFSDRVTAQVVGPQWSGYETSTMTATVACSLHPLGLGFPESLPTGIVDYGLEVRSQPDEYGALPQPSTQVVWIDDDRQLTQADLMVGDVAPAQRRLVRPTDPWVTTLDGLLTPLLTGGSTVMLVGGTDEQRAHIAATERAH